MLSAVLWYNVYMLYTCIYMVSCKCTRIHCIIKPLLLLLFIVTESNSKIAIANNYIAGQTFLIARNI